VAGEEGAERGGDRNEGLVFRVLSFLFKNLVVLSLPLSPRFFCFFDIDMRSSSLKMLVYKNGVLRKQAGRGTEG
jgi:hypothetical protein